MRGVCAFDVGLQGGVAIINEDIVIACAFETLDGGLDLKWLREFLLEHRDQFDRAVIEAVHAMPGQGVSSCFTFGRGLGHLEGLLAALQVPFTHVRPQAWQKGLGMVTLPKDAPKSAKKERGVRLAQQLYPTLDLKASERSRVPHLGIVDAVLIGHYFYNL